MERVAFARLLSVHGVRASSLSVLFWAQLAGANSSSSSVGRRAVHPHTLRHHAHHVRLLDTVHARLLSARSAMWRSLCLSLGSAEPDPYSTVGRYTGQFAHRDTGSTNREIQTAAHAHRGVLCVWLFRQSVHLLLCTSIVRLALSTHALFGCEFVGSSVSRSDRWLRHVCACCTSICVLHGRL